MNVVQTVGSFAAIGAVLGLALLGAIHASAHRDVRRLLRWSEAEPHRGDAGSPQGPVTAVPETSAAATAATAVSPAARRVTSERPALERVTGETPAIAAPTTGAWDRVRAIPNHPLAIALAAFVLGAGIFLGTLEVLTRSDEAPRRQTRPGGVVPSEVDVAVLNATSTTGLGGKVASDVGVNDFAVATVTDAGRRLDQTVVMFAPGERLAARAVARDLGVRPLQPIDRRARKIAGDADVVVLVGADRSQARRAK